ncbi:MAG TPA: AMP-binding protein, partial [Acidobacteriota bacterium]|nr:AMP-binding protein [Acidobacteriota bacterium]
MLATNQPRSARCEPEITLAQVSTPVLTVEEAVARGKGSDTSIMLYTSGTTGNPKGVVLSYDNLVKSSVAYAQLEGLTDREEV